MKRIISLLLLIGLILALAGCEASNGTLAVLSGSENETLEPIIRQFEKESNVKIEMKYLGSVDIMQELKGGDPQYDAVWPASSTWISLGDTNHLVKYTKSVLTTPVVFGIRDSLAEELGFKGRQVPVKDILKAINDKKLKFMMTSATQSNSGASAYMGFLYALLGNPDTITKADLQKEDLKKNVRELLSGINRTSGSSGWLKDLFLKGGYDAMVNYEALIIETNQELIRQGKEPLYVVYPYDGLVIADSPLGYINKGDSKKEENFKKFQDYLLSDKIQSEILQYGRRTGFGGMLGNTDPKVFNPDWGIDTKKVLSPIKLPASDVIEEALNLYQTQFKKPSVTVFCLDFSGSMAGNGETQVKKAMHTLLEQDLAKNYFLQSSPDDVIAVVPFSDRIFDTWQVKGNNPDDLNGLLQKIDSLSPDGGTDIYSPVMTAREFISQANTEGYIASIVLMTDGNSNTGASFSDLQQLWANSKNEIPVFSIMFGDASEKQLGSIADLTRAKVFDSKNDLIGAFRNVRGYN